MKDEVETRREELIEMIAESDDQLMEKFFENGTLSEAEMQKGLSKSISEGRIHPVLCTSASHNVGVRSLLDTIVSLSPSPVDRQPVTAVKAGSEDAAEVKIDQKGTTSAFVFKTLADPFAGRITLLKVYSGNLKSDSVLHNLNKDKDERLGTLQVFQGKSHEAIPEVAAGDICGVLKLKETKTGDTLADRGFSVMFPEVIYPEPAISFAVEPASRGDEEKIGSAVSKIMEEDPSLRFDRDQQTNEFLLSGSGQLHIEVSVGKLKKRFGVDVLLKTPKVPYRETITASADVQGRHKKQTGGHGQFGDCKIKMEPLTHKRGLRIRKQDLWWRDSKNLHSGRRERDCGSSFEGLSCWIPSREFQSSSL